MIDKQFTRIEAKLDALLTKAGIDPAKVVPAPPTAAAPAKLSAAEQQAIDNAPKPTPVQGPQRGVPRVDPATNAPAVVTSVPQNAVGNVTVETVETLPADPSVVGTGQAKQDRKPGKGKDGDRVNWNSRER